MKQLLALLILSCLVVPSAALADSNFSVTNYDSNLTVQDDGLVKVVETLGLSFPSPHYGFYRDIPYEYLQMDGSRVYSELSGISVTRNGQSVPFTVELNGTNERIKIGDANLTITGQQAYVLRYAARGVLRGYPGYDELYWNVTGNGWVVPLPVVSATISLPSLGITQSSCYVGLTGSQEACPPGVSNGQRVNFRSQRPLSLGQGLTVAVGYTKGMVPVSTLATPSQTVSSLVRRVNWPLSVAVFLAVLSLGWGLIGRLWYVQGRDFWWPMPELLKPGQSEQIMPIGAHDVVVVEFTPPDNLPPGILGLIKDERADTLDITASIVHLAVTGYITMAEVPKKWLLDSNDYTFSRSDTLSTSLMPYEELLLNRLFDGRKAFALSSLRNTFYTDLSNIKTQLYQDAVDQGYFLTDPERARQRYSWMSTGLVFVTFVFFLLAVEGVYFLVAAVFVALL
jgi:hypothetical protein